MEFEKVLQQRRSIRRYKPDCEISREVIEKVIHAGMLAPNAANKRPWEFYVVHDREKLEKVVSIHPAGKILKDASVLLVVCVRKSLGKPMPEEFLYLDAAAAVTQMLLQITDCGYSGCWVGAYPSTEKMQGLAEVLQLDEDCVAVASIVMGVADEEPAIRGFWEPEKVHYV